MLPLEAGGSAAPGQAWGSQAEAEALEQALPIPGEGAVTEIGGCPLPSAWPWLTLPLPCPHLSRASWVGSRDVLFWGCFSELCGQCSRWRTRHDSPPLGSGTNPHVYPASIPVWFWVCWLRSLGPPRRGRSSVQNRVLSLPSRRSPTAQG